MLDTLANKISEITPNDALIFSCGFEERAPVASSIFAAENVKTNHLLLLKYDEGGHDESESAIETNVSHLLQGNHRALIASVHDENEILEKLKKLRDSCERVFLDITGLNTRSIFRTLTQIHSLGFNLCIIYTEAEDYYPTKELVNSIDQEAEIIDVIDKLTVYEAGEDVYSMNCSANHIAGFEGHVSPNSPYYLIAFLAFKRSRLNAVIREIEAEKRIVISGKVEREDLKWRDQLQLNINFDLVKENSGNHIKSLSTLKWSDTLNFLEEVYHSGENKYRYNFVVTPLGSKMQTIACWAFGTRYGNVGFINVTPTKIFKDKYSKGSRATYVAMDFFKNANLVE